MNNYINSYLYFNGEKEMLSSIKAFLRKTNIRNTDSVVSLYYLYKKKKAWNISSLIYIPYVILSKQKIRTTHKDTPLVFLTQKNITVKIKQIKN